MFCFTQASKSLPSDTLSASIAPAIAALTTGVVLAETLRGATLTAERRETPENVDLAMRALLAVVSCSWSEAKEAARPAVAAMAAMGDGNGYGNRGFIENCDGDDEILETQSPPLVEDQLTKLSFRKLWCFFFPVPLRQWIRR
jgi:hypothetical protein